jgi:hypothetical protein
MQQSSVIKPSDYLYDDIDYFEAEWFKAILQSVNARLTTWHLLIQYLTRKPGCLTIKKRKVMIVILCLGSKYMTPKLEWDANGISEHYYHLSIIIANIKISTSVACPILALAMLKFLRCYNTSYAKIIYA